MILWLCAVGLVGAIAVAGYYQGAISAAFALVGLLLGAALSLPLSGLGQGILSMCGVQHPVYLQVLGPALVLLAIFFVFKSAGFYVQSKVHHYYKYSVPDDLRRNWEWLRQQLGLCLGVANGVVATFLIFIGVYVTGYFLAQVANEKDPWWMRATAALGKELNTSGFDRSLGPLVPASEFYFDAADVLGLVIRSPQLQERLSRYPLLLPLAEEPRFKEIGSDKAFQDFWKSQPGFNAFSTHARVKALFHDKEFFEKLRTLLRAELKDLRGYLEKGQSAKFAEELLVDRWHVDFAASYARARREKPNMTVAERQWLRSVYQASWTNAVLVAFLDNSLVLKKRNESGKPQTLQGQWKRAYGNKYLLSYKEDGRTGEWEAFVEKDQLVTSHDKLVVVFEK